MVSQYLINIITIGFKLCDFFSGLPINPYELPSNFFETLNHNIINKITMLGPKSNLIIIIMKSQFFICFIG